MDPSIIDNPIKSLNGIDLNKNNPFQSPFLQVDPSVFRPPEISSEYIFPDGSTKPSRGRFEMAFSQIGGTIMFGAVTGGALGAFRGWKEVSQMTEPFAIRRSHMLNYITRTGASFANTFGSVCLIYSALGVGLSLIQDENENLNTVIAATTTSTLYGALSKTKAMDNLKGSLLTKMRLKRAGYGFLIGALAATSMLFLIHPDNELMSKIKNQ